MNDFQEKTYRITAYREGNNFFVQSSYSDDLDIVVNTWYPPLTMMPNEQAFLVKKNSSILDYHKGELLHRNGDEFAAYNLGEYGYLGGNHGSPFGRMLTVRKHKMSTPDLGAELTDDKAQKYYILSVPDPDHIVIHPAAEKYGYPNFACFGEGQKIFRDGRELVYTDIKLQQIRPGNRVLKDVVLIDGKDALPDRTIVQCGFLDHVFEYEVLMPEARVDMFRQAPGIEHDFADPSLPALMRIRFESRHQPYGACVIRITNTVLHEFGLYRCLGVMMGWSESPENGTISSKGKTEFYIPKLKPLKATVNGKDGTIDFDFSAIQDLALDRENKVSYMIVKNDCLNPDDPPDRFIRLSGCGGKREYGSVLGYSLIEGSTAKEHKAHDRPEIYYLWYTRKSYPHCCLAKDPKPGDTRHVTAYRQYFDPQREVDATGFYWNRQGSSDVVYLDFHKNIERKTIKLPGYMTGKKISVIEQTASVKLLTSEEVPEEGICLSVTDCYGYTVLKLD